MHPERHGQIACGTVCVADLDRSVALYRDGLNYLPVQRGQIGVELSAAWGAPNVAGARCAVLEPAGDAPGALRLIEIPRVKGHLPATSIGWNAFEMTVKDVFALAQSIEGCGFHIDGPPKRVDGFTSFIPMQVFGPDGEVFFLNQVNHSDDDADLPQTECLVGEMFIAVLAARDREQSADEHARLLGLNRAATHSLRYGLMNRAFDLPPSTVQTISMVQNGRTPFSQIDQYPQSAPSRICQAGWLPPGNAIVSVLVDNLATLPLGRACVAEPVAPAGAVYWGRKTQVIRGAANELIELIEIDRG